jgi:hypothetical protein
MTLSFVPAPSFTDSIFKQPAFATLRRGKPTLRRPYSLRRGVRRLPFFLPARKPRGWSTEWRTSLPSCRILFWRMRAPLGAPSRRFLIPGSAFPGPRPFALSGLGAQAQHLNARRPRRGRRRPCPASSSRRGHSAPRSGPRDVPGAGLRAPPAGAASPPAVRTSHDNALGRRGWSGI